MFAVPPQTPQRQLPGAYVQTPAPSLHHQSGLTNQQNTRSGTATNQQQYGALTRQRQPGGQPASSPSAEALRPIERASRTINQTLEQESRYPALDTYVSRERSKCPTVSAMLTFRRGIFFRL